MIGSPRDEREWRQIVERKLAAQGQAVSAVTGQIIEVVPGVVEEALSYQPAAPIELVPGTSIYLNTKGEWRGRFTLDFPDVTVATDATPITVDWYELQGRPNGTRYYAESESGPSTILPPRATAKAIEPRVRIGNGASVRPPKATATARGRYPTLLAGDGASVWNQMATSNTSSLRVDDLDPGSQWVFRARAMSNKLPTPGAWSAEVTVQINADTSPPPQMTAPKVTVSRGTITVEWDGQSVSGGMPADFAYAELAQGTAAAPTEIIAYFYGGGGFTVVSDIPYYTPQFFRMRAVDESGNRGPWSEQSVAYVTPLVDTDVILSTIDAAKTQLINVDANVSILSNTILTRHLVVTEDMTVALLAAHQIVAGDIAANAITTDELAAGAVTAAKLTATLILTTAVIAGNATGTHARLDSSGLRVYAADPVDGVPNEVVRLGVNTSNDILGITRADGSIAANISEDGVIVGEELNAQTKLWYKGEELQTILDRYPKGLIVAAYRQSDSGTNAEVGAPIPYLRLEVPMKKGRIYRVWTSNMRWSRTAGAQVTVGIRYSTTGFATVSSNTLIQTTGETEAEAPVLQELFIVAADATASFLVWMGVSGGSAGFRPTAGYPVRLAVEDVGKLVYSMTNGVDMNGTTSPPAARNTYVSQYACTGSMNYQGSGAQYNFDTGRMYQGLSPAGYGNLNSIGLFNRAQIISDLSGATINYVRVYFNFAHWYYNSGGTANIGVHGHTSLPSTYTGVGPLTAISTGWPKPGARWVDLSPGHWDGFKTGSYCGVYLTGDSTYTTYGYADRPTLEIGYTK